MTRNEYFLNGSLLNRLKGCIVNKSTLQVIVLSITFGFFLLWLRQIKLLLASGRTQIGRISLSHDPEVILLPSTIPFPVRTILVISHSVYVWNGDIGQRMYIHYLLRFYIWYVGYFFRLYYFIFDCKFYYCRFYNSLLFAFQLHSAHWGFSLRVYCDCLIVCDLFVVPNDIVCHWLLV